MTAYQIISTAIVLLIASFAVVIGAAALAQFLGKKGLLSKGLLTYRPK
jgi:hypothetical protein